MSNGMMVLADTPKYTKVIKTDVQKQQNINIYKRMIVRETEIVKLKVNYPVIVGLKDTVYQSKLNSKIKLQVMDEIKNIELMAKEDSKEIKKEGWTFRPYELTINYDVKKSSDNILSFGITIYPYTGGTGNYTTQYYNISNKDKAEEIK